MGGYPSAAARAILFNYPFWDVFRVRGVPAISGSTPRFPFRMPRPRVRPEDRQRAPKACEPCKIAKKRCDSTLPCRTCVKKGIVPSCTYATSHGRGSSRWQRSRGDDLGSVVSHASSSELRPDARGSGSGGDVERPSSTPSGLQTPQSANMPTSQSPLMMLSSSGENGMPRPCRSHRLD